MRISKVEQDVFVLEGPTVRVSGQEIEFLKQQIPTAARGRVRLCAHGSEEDPIHEMLIALAHGCYVRPHKHLRKSESFHLVEGAADVVIFDEHGHIVEVIPLREGVTGGEFYYRLTQPLYHTVVARSDPVVIHETTGGPFRRGEAILPPWAPAEGTAEGTRYLTEIAAAAVQLLAREQPAPPLAPAPHGLIIGGTRGVGRAVARCFATQGHTVSVVGRHGPEVADQQLAGVTHWKAELRDHRALADVLDAIVTRGGPLRNLVFLQRFRGEGDPWLGELETSLSATRFVIERLTDRFRESADNSIVIVGSIADRFVSDSQPLGYHVAKAGLAQMVRYYAALLGSRGIRVNGVAPGIVVKEENRDTYRDDRPLGRLLQSCAPLRRLGTAADVAQVIAFLCSTHASYITGQRITVDGGVSLLSQESLVRGLRGDHDG